MKEKKYSSLQKHLSENFVFRKKNIFFKFPSIEDTIYQLSFKKIDILKSKLDFNFNTKITLQKKATLKIEQLKMDLKEMPYERKFLIKTLTNIFLIFLFFHILHIYLFPISYHGAF